MNCFYKNLAYSVLYGQNVSDDYSYAPTQSGVKEAIPILYSTVIYGLLF